MIGLLRGRLPGLMVFAAGMCAVTDARADIPFADQVIPGELRGIARTEDSAWPASDFEYLPSDFDIVDEDTTYPLLVTLGGVGTMDNISICPDFAPTCTLDDCLAQGFDGLCRVLGRGPAIEIRQGVYESPNDFTVDVSVAPEVIRAGTSSSSGGSGTGDAETGSGLSTGAFTSSTTEPGDASSTASSSGVEDTDSDGESSTAGSASSSGGCSTAGGSSAWSWLLMFACVLRHRRRDTITKRPQA